MGTAQDPMSDGFQQHDPSSSTSASAAMVTGLENLQETMVWTWLKYGGFL